VEPDRRAPVLRPAKPWIAAGYRVRAFEQQIGGVDQNLQTRGPYIGVGFTI